MSYDPTKPLPRAATVDDLLAMPLEKPAVGAEVAHFGAAASLLAWCNSCLRDPKRGDTDTAKWMAARGRYEVRLHDLAPVVLALFKKKKLDASAVFGVLRGSQRIIDDDACQNALLNLQLHDAESDFISTADISERRGCTEEQATRIAKQLEAQGAKKIKGKWQVPLMGYLLWSDSHKVRGKNETAGIYR